MWESSCGDAASKCIVWVVMRCNVFPPVLSPLMTYSFGETERECVCVAIVSVIGMFSCAVSPVVVGLLLLHADVAVVGYLYVCM